MQKRTFRLIAITAGLLSGASLLFLCHRAKQQAQAEMIAARRGIVRGHHICSHAEECKIREIMADLKESCNNTVK